jgi:ubiquinone/menaquinone biosynthesis C-methylase UbiE
MSLRPGSRSGLDRSRAFWDEKAQENAAWYVSSYGAYAAERNMDEFFASGRRIWADLKSLTQYVPSPSDRVVEIGCGLGRLTRAIASDVGHVDAFDISSEMIRRASEANLANATFHLGKGSSVQPVADHTADYVIAYCVLQHLPSEEVLGAYLQDMVRVARPGAVVAFTLSKRTWMTLLLPALRARRWLTEVISSHGPRGIYRHEWTGIRPSIERVRSLSPVALEYSEMHGDKWLFWGRNTARP